MTRLMPASLSHQELIVIADRISGRLLDDLKTQKIGLINIDTIRSALWSDAPGVSPDQRDQLETLTTKRIIVRAG